MLKNLFNKNENEKLHFVNVKYEVKEILINEYDLTIDLKEQIVEGLPEFNKMWFNKLPDNIGLVAMQDNLIARIYPIDKMCTDRVVVFTFKENPEENDGVYMILRADVMSYTKELLKKFVSTLDIK